MKHAYCLFTTASLLSYEESDCAYLGAYETLAPKEAVGHLKSEVEVSEGLYRVRLGLFRCIWCCMKQVLLKRQ
jgi:hypothetical protein